MGCGSWEFGVRLEIRERHEKETGRVTTKSAENTKIRMVMNYERREKRESLAEAQRALRQRC
jgi:hypothetical protein